MPDSMATLLPLLVIFSALCGSTVALQLQKYASIGSVGPYKDPGIGGTTCELYHSVSAAHSLHSAVDVSWKVGIAFTQPSMIIEQTFVVTGVLYLLWFVASATCIITFAFLSSVIARIQPYPPNRLLEKQCIFIRTLSGEVLHTHIPSNSKIRAIKKVIEARLGIQCELQQLFFGRKLLLDHQTLSILPNEAHIDLKFLLVGGPNYFCDICDDPGVYTCSQCNQVTCAECCTRVHKHPKRNSHTPKQIETQHSNMSTANSLSCASTVSSMSTSDFSDDDDFLNSPSVDAVLTQATRIATLAQHFNLTSFNEFQQEIIDAVLAKKDTIVIQPTGSGKSLCYQFPPVHEQKKAIVVTPTISLMQDQVKNLEQKGIKAIYLGSAQLDKTAEERAFADDSINLVYVTPEWIAKESNKFKISQLQSNNKLSLIAIDEAHLCHYWREFRRAYMDLETLKSAFLATPIMLLTATAPPEVFDSISKLVRHPVVSKGSMNRPNVKLSCKELPCHARGNFYDFALRVSEIAGDRCTIVYTNFIENIGPIISELSDLGHSCVGYYGEMDPKSRLESYTRWKSGEAQIMVATAAFGMGIDHPGIRHVIRYGVPDSLCSWVQEFGRAGRDGEPATATCFYSASDTDHAGAWIKDNLYNFGFCDRILGEYSTAWKFVWSNFAGKCRRQVLLEEFQDPATLSDDICSECCDVCEKKCTNELDLRDLKVELKILINAIDTLHQKGEKKIAEWIRGSSLTWTQPYNKQSTSYGNHRGHSQDWWRNFMKQCHVVGLVNRKLKSMVKRSGHYSVFGIYEATQKGRESISDDCKDEIMLPSIDDSESIPASTPATSSEDHSESQKRVRHGKGTHAIITVRRMMSDKENWVKLSNAVECQYPGVFSDRQRQCVYYTSNFSELSSSTEPDSHFLWNDIQLSKGKINNYTCTFDIDGEKEELVYRSAPCNGVKVCSEPGCDHVAPMRDQRACKKHPKMPLRKTNTTESKCPVQFAYIFPKNNTDDKRRWIFGFVRQQKENTSNLHSHAIHGASHLLSATKQSIVKAAQLNPTLTPMEVAQGKGIGYIPGSVDHAGAHLGRISSALKKGRNPIQWDVQNFEVIADEIDASEENIGGSTDNTQRVKELCRPYLVSARIEGGIKYIFTMNPFQCKVLSTAEFIECDLTYNESIEYPYLFNAVAFNDDTMEWVVVARVRLDKEGAKGYGLAYKKMFEKCSDYPEFEVGKSLNGVVTDWSDAEIAGLRGAIGEDLGKKLLKGCQVHWNRSWQRIRERVASSNDKSLEKSVFGKIASSIVKLPVGRQVTTAFEVLCGNRCAKSLLGIVKSLTVDEANFVDSSCNWKKAKHWAEWWLRPQHLQMLHKEFSEMQIDNWLRCPSDTNAVERKNRESKDTTPLPIQQAMINRYKADKFVCAKQVAAEEEVKITYHDRSESARRDSAKKRNAQRYKSSGKVDKEAQFGPPDKAQHFSGKRSPISESSSARPPAKKLHTTTADRSKFSPGMKVKMQFFIEESESYEWFEGVVQYYDKGAKKYAVYFSSDDETVFVDSDESDVEIVE